MDHVLSGHTEGGSRTVSSNKSLFPSSMDSKQIEGAIRQAYRYGERISGNGDRVLVRGSYAAGRIEMYVNTKTRTIETAYPVGSRR